MLRIAQRGSSVEVEWVGKAPEYPKPRNVPVRGWIILLLQKFDRIGWKTVWKSKVRVSGSSSGGLATLRASFTPPSCSGECRYLVWVLAHVGARSYVESTAVPVGEKEYVYKEHHLAQLAENCKKIDLGSHKWARCWLDIPGISPNSIGEIIVRGVGYGSIYGRKARIGFFLNQVRPGDYDAKIILFYPRPESYDARLHIGKTVYLTLLNKVPA